MNRRALIAVAVTVVALGALVISQMSRGQAVDACASQLVDAAKRSDEGALAEVLDNASIRSDLLHAGEVEYLFARPRSSRWSMVGLALRPTRSATAARAVVLLLSNDDLPRCRFLQDLDPGPFH